jgi:hypothetical protein
MGEPDALSISTFFHQLGFKIEIAKRTQKQLDLYLATGMNIVRDYIQPDENRISDMLADLLTPDGSHGQGSVFLGLFLKEVGLSYKVEDADFARIREHSTSGGRRIDILLPFTGKKAIGIENKPFAADQLNQVNDYCDYLHDRYAGEYVLFYLTPGGFNPPPESIREEKRTELMALGKLCCISYQADITRWLENCFRECKAERVRWLLKDLIDFIDERLGDDGPEEGGIGDAE